MNQLVRPRVEPPDGWTLTPVDARLIAAKSRANRLPFAVLLLFFRAHGRFPRAQDEIKPETVADVMRQLGIGLEPTQLPAFSGRTVERHRAEIRTLLGFREVTVADGEVLTEWLCDHAVGESRSIDWLAGELEQRCRGMKDSFEIIVYPVIGPLQVGSERVVFTEEVSDGPAQEALRQSQRLKFFRSLLHLRPDWWSLSRTDRLPFFRRLVPDLIFDSISAI